MPCNTQHLLESYSLRHLGEDSGTWAGAGRITRRGRGGGAGGSRRDSTGDGTGGGTGQQLSSEDIVAAAQHIIGALGDTSRGVGTIDG